MGQARLDRWPENGGAAMRDGTAIPTTEDALLDGRVRLRQPKFGYRVATDPVFLAAAVPARPGELILDLGMGVGAAALCLAHRVRGCLVVGVECQADLACLAQANGRLNALCVSGVIGDVGALPFRADVFDHVMANPPFLVSGHASPSPSTAKTRANQANAETDLALWIAAGFASLKRGGSMTLIQRADRLDDVLAGLAGQGGGIAIFPLWPRAGMAAAKRVLGRAIKGSRAPLRLAPGLVVHGADSSYTAAAAAVLRDGQALTL